MNDQAIPFEGGCPECHEMTTMLNIERNHFGVCKTHKVQWLIGRNLYSGWRHEDEAQWMENAALLESYQEVEPVFPLPEPEPELSQAVCAAMTAYSALSDPEKERFKKLISSVDLPF